MDAQGARGLRGGGGVWDRGGGHIGLFLSPSHFTSPAFNPAAGERPAGL